MIGTLVFKEALLVVVSVLKPDIFKMSGLECQASIQQLQQKEAMNVVWAYCQAPDLNLIA